MKRIHRNNRGSALQIVLVTFMIITVSFSIYLSFLRFQTNHYQDISRLMKQKNLEILLIQSYVQDIQDGFLFSSSYEDENNCVENTIDDMGSYYHICTSVNLDTLTYEFIVDLEKNTGHLRQLSYRED